MTDSKQRVPEQYYLSKPDLKKVDKSRVFEKLEKLGEEFGRFFEKANEPRFLYWDELKYKTPPMGLSSEEYWFLVRQLRTFSSRKTSIKTEDGDYFKWFRLSCVDEFLHTIDMSSGGQVFTTMEVLSGPNRQKFISRGIIEESIASSQLEGAHTTRQAAKEMLTQKREPRNTDEQMILNNYNTMLKLEQDYKNQQLTEDILFELHRMLTYGTIPEKSQGKYRSDMDKIVVQGSMGAHEYVTHVPPKETFVKEEIKKLIDYANDADGEEFIHPIIKAIFIHFWFGYLHPFVDGNGRLARALFYWYLLRKNYWTFMYLPISTVIKLAPIQYAMAYIYSEQDSHDATYFFDFHIRKIMQSLKSFNDYVSRKILENKEVDKIVSKEMKLNDRQKYLVHHLVSDGSAYTTVTSHSTLNSVSRQTAAMDIKHLENLGLLTSVRDGKYIKYSASEKLLKRNGL